MYYFQQNLFDEGTIIIRNVKTKDENFELELRKKQSISKQTLILRIIKCLTIYDNI